MTVKTSPAFRHRRVDARYQLQDQNPQMTAA